jgi:hypothetical protein
MSGMLQHTCMKLLSWKAQHHDSMMIITNKQ